MDALKFHLLLNYYPAIAVLIATFLLVAGFIWNGERMKRWGLNLIVFAALLSIFVFETGEVGAGKAAYSGPSAQSMEAHRQAARPAFVALAVAGFLSVIGLIMYGRKSQHTQKAVIAARVMSVIANGLLLHTTYLGRNIKFAGTTQGKLQQ